MKAIQDHYAPLFAHCYGCGPANAKGHRLKSYLVGEQTVARFTPSMEHTGGVPENVYGGLLASLLDCHGTATAAAFAYRARGRTLDDGGDTIRFVTASLKVDYKRPTPMGKELLIQGALLSLVGRKAEVQLSLSADGEVCVTGTMLAIELPSPQVASPEV